MNKGMNERLKQIRKSQNLSQKQFAELLSLSQNYISYLEKGVRDLNDRVINEICKEFNINKEWFLTGKGEMFNDILDSFDIEDKEIKEFVKLFLESDEETRIYIKGLMKKTLKKK